MSKNTIIEALIHEAFAEKSRTDNRQDDEIQDLSAKFSDVKELYVLMDKKLDEFLERLKRLEDHVGKVNINSNTFYQAYKNGDEE